MAKIRISLNEVVRDFLGQMITVYDKYILEEESGLTQADIINFDLSEHFDFQSLNHMNGFIYSEAALEIFGHADTSSPHISSGLNEYVMNMIDEGHEVEIVSREVNRAIPSTLFFLSKIVSTAPNLVFVKNNEDEWGDADILITANPIALANKPEGKVSIMIKAPYNADSEADFVFDYALELFKSEKMSEEVVERITENLTKKIC